jgi:diadenosine tetraphosphatase ApaH/serine/threonine PP2A family protein phosphatase
MRVAVISDVHSNAEALEAVLEDGSQHGVGAWWCLGDVVGYGAEPDRVVERVRGLGAVTVAGNHDWAACGRISVQFFNRAAATAAQWTGRNMKPENLAWLAALPVLERQDGALLVHATPSQPEAWRYCMSVETARDEMASYDDALCMIGHSHFPGTFEREGESVRYTRAEEVRLRPDRQYLVNVGSVGQPRDGDSRAAYLLYDTEELWLRHVRVTYDFASAQAKILAAGLPRFLADRLAVGE